jgi:predicted AAA+ superfamily ATPase
MNILEKLYEIDFEKIFSYQRKIDISHNYTIISGANKSGKSYLIYDYLKQYKSKQYLYIDLNDIRIDVDRIFLNLDRFLLEQKDIKILVLDNCDIKLDNVLQNLTFLDSIIISTTKSLLLDKFTNIELNPLDFEEYILFDTKHQTAINSFNSFLKFGNFPQIIQVSENNKISRNQEILKLIVNNSLEFEILKLLIQSSGELKSIFQLFNSFKQNHKISKDSFYKIVALFEDKNIIYFCKKFNSPKAPKRVYCYNHALIDAVNLNKKFNNIFSNIIFLELNKRYKNINYLDWVDFYLQEQNSIILSIAFFNDLNSISSRIIKTIEDNNISNITIITINTNKTIYINDIECEVLPFYQWALGL